MQLQVANNLFDTLIEEEVSCSVIVVIYSTGASGETPKIIGEVCSSNMDESSQPLSDRQWIIQPETVQIDLQP